MPKPIHIIVACAENRVIGRGRKLPWRIPEDLEFFHRETAGKICILGRICYETWPRVHQDGRRPIVLTSRPLADRRGLAPSASDDGAATAAAAPHSDQHAPVAVRSLRDALAVADALPGEICICGGQHVYEETLALDRPMRLHLTLIHADIPGDRFFPEWRHLPWREVSRREGADANYRYTFFTYERYQS